MPFAGRVRARTGLLVAISAISLGTLGMLPATASARAVPVTPGAAIRMAAAVRPAAVPAGSQEVRAKCVTIHVTPNGHEESVNCAELWFLDDGNESMMTAQNVVFCQETIANMPIVDCDSIRESASIVSPEFPTLSESGECGTIIGHSDCGARLVTNNAPPREFPGLDHGGTCSFTASSSATVETSDDQVHSASVTTNPFSHNC
jgi:hypothetical protein